MPAAIAEARRLLAKTAQDQPEVIDLTTGRPVAPGADKPDRDDLASKIGY